LSRLLAIQLSYSALFKASALKEGGDLEGALAAARKAVEINPTLPEALYDLACYYALVGMKDEALEALGHALTLAPEFKQMAREDSDLETLREEDAFKTMVED
jgi:Flp pilus assembly protein TadD